MANQVTDISEEIIKLPVLVALLETTVKGVRKPIRAKIWDDDGTFYATFSHTHAFPPTDMTRQNVIDMKIIATHYLRDFKNDSVKVNKDFNKIPGYHQ